MSSFQDGCVKSIHQINSYQQAGFNPHSALCNRQASATSLTREQQYVADRMVEAHRLFRSQDAGHHRVNSRHRLTSNLCHVPLTLCCVSLSSLSGCAPRKPRLWRPTPRRLACRDSCSSPGRSQVRNSVLFYCVCFISVIFYVFLKT